MLRPNDETSMLRYFNARVRTSKIMILHLQDTTLKHKISFYKIQEPSVDCTWINRRPDLWYVENPQRVCGPGRRVGYMSGISRIICVIPYLLCSHLPAHHSGVHTWQPRPEIVSYHVIRTFYPLVTKSPYPTRFFRVTLNHTLFLSTYIRQALLACVWHTAREHGVSVRCT